VRGFPPSPAAAAAAAAAGRGFEVWWGRSAQVASSGTEASFSSSSSFLGFLSFFLSRALFLGRRTAGRAAQAASVAPATVCWLTDDEVLSLSL